MSRLQSELQRLYLSHPGELPGHGSGALSLIGTDGRVRAMVLALARPACWEDLARVWQGVQADLELPAPAIAVSGSDGYQLWFSLAEAVPAAEAIAFLESLRRSYLDDVLPGRLGMFPGVDPSAPANLRHLGTLPPAQVAPGRWSAFVAPDLASLFADDPCLDLPPATDAQAEQLSRCASAQPDEWKRALERLRPASTLAATPAAAPVASSEAVATPVAPGDVGSQEPRQFLLGVMNDRSIELHLRIEAAKALLSFPEAARP